MVASGQYLWAGDSASPALPAPWITWESLSQPRQAWRSTGSRHKVREVCLAQTGLSADVGTVE